MKRGLVTVIVPAYNMENYLRNCVTSVINQTYANWELLIIDDGSTDSTSIICDEMAEEDNRISVIHKENGGLSDAMNTGLNAARGEYISFLDADDGYHPEFIESLLLALEENDCDIAMCDVFVTNSPEHHFFDLKNKEYEILSGQEAAKRCIGGYTIDYIVAWNKIYRRKLFDKIRYPLGEINEDEFITWKLLWKSKKVVYVHLFLHNYYQRKDSIMGSPYSRERTRVVNALEERRDFFYEKECYSEAMQLTLDIDYLLSYAIDELEDKGENVTDLRTKKRKNKKINEIINKDYFRSFKFPFEQFNDNAMIAIYGAGALGQSFYEQAREAGIIDRIIWVDRYKIRHDKEILSLDYLQSNRIQYVVIAILNYERQLQVRHMLNNMGFDDKMIIWKECWD